MNKTSNKKTNRRLAFRVYEQVNLFYQKIDPAQQSEMTRPVGSLPHSESRENDTLNVNISASGIAFTCQEPLIPGDYLSLRVLLLSHMTTITTCCKVVYCKPSNPYEDHQYPYWVGGRFINLTAADEQLLSRHLHKKRNQQILMYSLWSVALLCLLTAPDIVLEIVLDLSHQLFETLLHGFDVAIDMIEMNIDHLIEHTLHTDLHTTQIISFYISLVLKLLAVWVLWKTIPPRCLALAKRIRRFWSRKTASLRYVWSEQSLLNKIKFSGLGIGLIIGYVMFAL